MNLPERENLFPRDVARFLNVSEATVYRYFRSQELPCVQLGRTYRVPRREFVKWYDARIKRAA